MHPPALPASPPAIHISPPECEAHPYSLVKDREEGSDVYRPRYLHPHPLMHRVPKQALRDSSKPPELRVAIARKSHSSKQAERRARFLAKIGAPPSPDAIDLPATPPDSPAVFHFTLPSPGMTSPLPLFQSLKSVEDSSTPCRLERVNFRCQMPTLEEISSRLNLPPPCRPSRPSIALPSFLDHYPKGGAPVAHGSSRSPIHFMYESSRRCFSHGRDFLTEANLRAWERVNWAVPLCWH